MELIMVNFTKTYTSPAQLVALLQYRGLLIEDATKTENYLRHIGYYRFSAYLHPLLSIPKEDHIFKKGASFNQALTMYRFDRHLRLLMFNQIEKIEIAVRSAIVNITSRETGNPFWMTDPSCFYDAAQFTKTKQLIDAELAKSREDFIEHFRNTYVEPYPPAWMLAEILPLGVMTKIYDNIKQPNSQENSTRIFAEYTCIQVMDDNYYGYAQQLLSSFSRLEPYIRFAGLVNASYFTPLDFCNNQSAKGFL